MIRSQSMYHSINRITAKKASKDFSVFAFMEFESD